MPTVRITARPPITSHLARDRPAPLSGPDDPDDPRVVFEWIEAHVAELRRRGASQELELFKRKLDSEENLVVEIAVEGETVHSVAADATCADYEEFDVGTWMELSGATTRSYYLFEGELVAVLEEKSTWWSSNEIGECNDFESTEAFFVWQGHLLAHWTEEDRFNCYCDDSIDEEPDEADRCDESSSNRPVPASLGFSDDPLEEQLRAELRVLLTTDGPAPYLECELSHS
ncbi:MAG: hypothetical protein R6X02_27280 [Enhygromyxa sp.]